MANVWMHNGFLQVEGEKMSKSLGNFFSINELLTTDVFGKQPWHGRVLRFAMLSTHYRQPIDWTLDRLMAAKNALQEFAALVHDVAPASAANADVLGALRDDLNTPSAISILHGLSKSAKRGDAAKAADLRATLEFMGLYGGETAAELSLQTFAQVDAKKVWALIADRLEARKAKNFKESDRIRDEITAMGVVLKDAKDPKTGEIVTTWEMKR